MFQKIYRNYSSFEGRLLPIRQDEVTVVLAGIRKEKEVYRISHVLGNCSVCRIR